MPFYLYRVKKSKWYIVIVESTSLFRGKENENLGSTPKPTCMQILKSPV